MMNCVDVRDLLSPYADGELDSERRLAVADHLGMCTECAGELAEVESLGDVLHLDVDPLDLHDRVMASLPRRSSGVSWWMRTAAAVAASVALGFVAGGALQRPAERAARADAIPVLGEIEGSFGSASLAGFDDLAADLQRGR